MLAYSYTHAVQHVDTRALHNVRREAARHAVLTPLSMRREKTQFLFQIILFNESHGRRLNFKDRTFSPLLQRCLTVIFSTLIVVLEMDFLFRPL